MSATTERLGIAQLERRLGVHRKTVAAWVRAGKFPRPHYLGGELRRWWLHDVEAWERANTRTEPDTARTERLERKAA